MDEHYRKAEGLSQLDLFGSEETASRPYLLVGAVVAIAVVAIALLV